MNRAVVSLLLLDYISNESDKLDYPVRKVKFLFSVHGPWQFAHNYAKLAYLVRIFHKLTAPTVDMSVLPGVLGCRTLRRTAPDYVTNRIGWEAALLLQLTIALEEIDNER